MLLLPHSNTQIKCVKRHAPLVIRLATQPRRHDLAPRLNVFDTLRRRLPCLMLGEDRLPLGFKGAPTSAKLAELLAHQGRRVCVQQRQILDQCSLAAADPYQQRGR